MTCGKSRGSPSNLSLGVILDLGLGYSTLQLFRIISFDSQIEECLFYHPFETEARLSRIIYKKSVLTARETQNVSDYCIVMLLYDCDMSHVTVK